MLPEITVNICYVIFTDKPIKKEWFDNFLSSRQDSQISFFTQRSFLKYHWHQMVTFDLLPPIGIAIDVLPDFFFNLQKFPNPDVYYENIQSHCML